MRRSVERKCSLWWCDGLHYAWGLCERHYQNVRRYGAAIAPTARDVQVLTRRCDEMALLIAELADGYVADDFCTICGETLHHSDFCVVGKALDLARDTLRSWEPDVEVS